MINITEYIRKSRNLRSGSDLLKRVVISLFYFLRVIYSRRVTYSREWSFRARTVTILVLLIKFVCIIYYLNIFTIVRGRPFVKFSCFSRKFLTGFLLWMSVCTTVEYWTWFNFECVWSNFLGGSKTFSWNQVNTDY